MNESHGALLTIIVNNAYNERDPESWKRMVAQVNANTAAAVSSKNR